MFNKIKTFLRGTHVPPHKELTANSPITPCPAPEKVYLPLNMHIGAPAEPCVKLGDIVNKGQVIAQATSLVSSNIHSSVSGRVIEIARRFYPNGALTRCIVIKNDFEDRWDDSITNFRPENIISPEETRTLLKEKGIVGMGGATFPTHVKYMPAKDGQIIDTILLNGIECEPYITADHRIMLEKAPEIIRGLKYLMKAALAQNGIIAIEDNKPDAIALLQNLTANEEHISVVVCAEKYPQGSEKQLIYAATGRIVPVRGLPSAVGIIVNNVSTAVWACVAIEKNIPCIDRVVTLSGNAINKPGNYLVPIGTLFSHVVQTAGEGTNGDLARILTGGPMMGFSVSSMEYPITKGNNAILVFNHEDNISHFTPEQTCVRCGHCVDTCPMFLEPTQIVNAVKRQAWSHALGYDIMSCLECGSCAFVCPAHIPLVQYIRMGKQFIATDGIGGKNPYFQK